MASINRDSLAHHLRVVASKYADNASAVTAVNARLAEQFTRQAAECVALADALDDGEPLALTD